MKPAAGRGVQHGAERQMPRKLGDKRWVSGGGAPCKVTATAPPPHTPVLVFCLSSPPARMGTSRQTHPPFPFLPKRLFQAVSKRVAGTGEAKAQLARGLLGECSARGRCGSRHLLSPPSLAERVRLPGGRRQMDRNDPRLPPEPTSKYKEEEACCPFSVVKFQTQRRF